MRIRSFWPVICALFFLSGCVTESTNKVTGAKPDSPSSSGTALLQAPPLLPPEVLDKKIENLSRILENNKLNEDERNIALNLQNTYKTMKILNQDSATKLEVTRQMIVMLFNHLSQLEDRYFQRKQPDARYYQEAVSVLNLKKKKIQESYLAGDYQSVINQCLDLESTLGREALTPDIGLFFAVALAEKGLLKEASRVSQTITPEWEGKPDLILLRTKYLEWQLAQGNKELAQQIYEKAVDDLDKKQLLLKRAKQKLSGEAPIKVAGTEKSVSETLPVTSPLAKILKEVEEFIQQNQFSKAKLLLSNQLNQFRGAEAETLEQALRSVLSAEEKYQKDEDAQKAQKTEAVTAAQKLMQEGKNEEALQKLTSLGDENNLDPQVKLLRETAERKYLDDELKKAALLFSSAKKTGDPEKKKSLLLSSYQKLKSLIERFPRSTLISKLNDYTQKVIEELKKVGVNPS